MMKKRPFTLTEILIVLLLITVVASVVGFNALFTTRDQRFRSAVESISDKIQLIEYVGSIFNVDMTLTLEKDSQHSHTLLCSIKSEKNLPTAIHHLLNNQSTIPGISSLQFVDHQRKTHTNSVSLLFKSRSHQLTAGVLTLSYYHSPHEKGPLIQNLVLGTQEATNESEILYPKEVRDDWKQRQIKS